MIHVDVHTPDTPWVERLRAELLSVFVSTRLQIFSSGDEHPRSARVSRAGEGQRGKEEEEEQEEAEATCWSACLSVQNARAEAKSHGGQTSPSKASRPLNSVAGVSARAYFLRENFRTSVVYFK